MEKKVKYGCLIPAIVVGCLPIVLIIVIVIGLAFTPTTKPILLEDAKYSNTDSLQALTGLSIIPEVRLEEAWNNNNSFDYYVSKYIYHYNDSVINPQDKKVILEYAQKDKRTYRWIYGEKCNSNAFAVYTDFNFNDSILYEIAFCDSLVCLTIKEYFSFCKDQQEFAHNLGIDNFPKYEIKSFDAYYVGITIDGGETYYLQLLESPAELIRQLKAAGYTKTEREKETVYELSYSPSSDVQKPTNIPYDETTVFFDNKNPRMVTICFSNY